MDELTTTQAAAMLGLKKIAIQQAIRRGTLQAVKRGRDWFITRDELARYLKEHRGRVGRPRSRKGRRYG